jgi:hypothetical protein
MRVRRGVGSERSRDGSRRLRLAGLALLVGVALGGPAALQAGAGATSVSGSASPRDVSSGPSAQVVRNYDGRLEVFCSCGQGTIHAWQLYANGPWSAWEQLSPDLTGVVVTENADGRLEAFFDTNGQAPEGIYHMWQLRGGGSWSAAIPLLGGVPDVAFDPAVVRNGDGRLEVFWQEAGPADEAAPVYHAWQLRSGGSWSPAVVLDDEPQPRAPLTAVPSRVAFNSMALVVGATEVSVLQRLGTNGWLPSYTDLPPVPGGLAAAAPVAASVPTFGSGAPFLYAPSAGGGVYQLDGASPTPAWEPISDVVTSRVLATEEWTGATTLAYVGVAPAAGADAAPTAAGSQAFHQRRSSPDGGWGTAQALGPPRGELQHVLGVESNNDHRVEAFFLVDPPVPPRSTTVPGTPLTPVLHAWQLQGGSSAWSPLIGVP